VNQPRIGAHPAGLVVVILTGMWEVFALFGMRSVLVFYLTQDLAFSSVSAIQVYSLSTSAAMAMSLVGGVVADRWLGVQRAVICGAIGMAAGHLLLVVPQLLFPALLLLTVSNGLFKPSLVAQMNRLYATNEPARDRAFTLYKAGCNGAAIFAPIVTGIVGTAWSWRAALALCGIGMVISSVIFLAFRRYLVEADFRGAAGIDKDSAPHDRRFRDVYSGGLVSVGEPDHHCVLHAAHQLVVGAAWWGKRRRGRAAQVENWRDPADSVLCHCCHCGTDVHDTGSLGVAVHSAVLSHGG
jgi:Major Facilitator Superfamily